VIIGYGTLYGTIPPEIMELKNLKKIDIEQNVMTGTIPSAIAQLTYLQWLLISRLKYRATRSRKFFMLFDFSIFLRVMFSSTNAGKNDFTGTIPSTLGRMSSMTRIAMYANKFTSTLPDEIGSMSSLQYVDFKTFSLELYLVFMVICKI